MSTPSSASVVFRPLSGSATSPSCARSSELCLDGNFMSVESHKRVDRVRIHRAVGVDGGELTSTWFLSRAETRALALELLAAVDAAEPPEFELPAEDIGYALNRSVPDMVRGFTIQTNYPDLRIPQGELAERIQAVLGSALGARRAVTVAADAT